MSKEKITDAQLLEERRNGLTLREIAEKYGMHIRTVEARSGKLSRMGHGHGRDYSSMVPDGYKVKGVSSLIGKDGEFKQGWLKTDQDKERQIELMRMAVEALCENVDPVPPLPFSQSDLQRIHSQHLLNLYTVSDYHLGMLAWGEESGDDWDLSIARDLFYKWFGAAFETSPAARVGVINLLGDFAHFDGLEAVTNASGHVLDADTRYQKLVRYMIQMVKSVVSMALQKHEEVRLLIVQGNHDESGMIWLAEMFNALYVDEPRVIVDTDPDVYKMIEHGKTSLFFHHGHKARFDAIEAVMISKYRETFGRTQYSYAHVGHLHHQKLVESRNMVIEQHRTLAAKDAYASRGGWLSKRSANVITYSDQYGEVSRLTISPEMLK